MIPRKFDFTLKIVVVGDSGVGKTCLLLRYIKDVFTPGTPSTLGVEFMSKLIETEKHRIQLQLWDTAGQEIFRSVTRGYYRGASGALVLFDLTNPDSLSHVARWVQDVREVARSDVATVLLGNKADLTADRHVTREEAERVAQENKMLYFETSALSGANVSEAIAAIVGVIESYVADGVYDLTPNPGPQQFLEPEPEKPACTC
jgi:small GTP-binding protein